MPAGTHPGNLVVGWDGMKSYLEKNMNQEGWIAKPTSTWQQEWSFIVKPYSFHWSQWEGAPIVMGTIGHWKDYGIKLHSCWLILPKAVRGAGELILTSQLLESNPYTELSQLISTRAGNGFASKATCDRISHATDVIPYKVSLLDPLTEELTYPLQNFSCQRKYTCSSSTWSFDTN